MQLFPSCDKQDPMKHASKADNKHGGAAVGGPQQMAAKAPFKKFVTSYAVANAWMSQYNIEALVEAGGGLCRISNFLPEHIAEGILEIVASVPEAKWNETAASDDYTHNNISHSFKSTKGDGRGDLGVDAVCRLFSLLQPGALNAFSAARYMRSDHIAPHDDRAYTPVSQSIPEAPCRPCMRRPQPNIIAAAILLVLACHTHACMHVNCRRP